MSMHLIRHKPTYVLQRIKPTGMQWADNLRGKVMRAWVTVPGTDRVRKFSTRQTAEYWAEWHAHHEPDYTFNVLEWKLW